MSESHVVEVDYGTTGMFVKQTIKRCRDAHERNKGMMPYQQVILVLADEIERLRLDAQQWKTAFAEECRENDRLRAKHRPARCEACVGEGKIEYGHPNAPEPERVETCKECNGSGNASDELPPGMDEYTMFRRIATADVQALKQGLSDLYGLIAEIGGVPDEKYAIVTRAAALIESNAPAEVMRSTPAQPSHQGDF